MILKLSFILFGVLLVLWGIYSTKKYETFLDKITGIGQFLAGIACIIIGILNFINESKLLNINLLSVIGVAPLAHEPNILEYRKTKISPHHSCL
ncbi:hypothetical protein CN571_25320 [Bacillus pseudomycoides]|uniref:hypothetical protein n=1 Tax=Bacillus pseudomycoides TaxID=64104 RepID=UPI000BF2BF9E|nr:hypothetical protein [Bacillus pseudomycoides]PEO82574.1 hypothetical protein CN571_25320 [Bacillus pseudomycoides]